MIEPGRGHVASLVQPDRLALAARRRTGYTQEDLASRCCLHVSYISKMEAGTGLPGINTLVRLARSLGVSADDLLRGIEWTPCPLPAAKSCTERNPA